jgi:Zn-dependent protease with chaperone function
MNITEMNKMYQAMDPYEYRLMENLFVDMDKKPLDDMQSVIDEYKKPSIRKILRPFETLLVRIPLLNAILSQPFVELRDTLNSFIEGVEINSYLIKNSIPNMYTFPFSPVASKRSVIGAASAADFIGVPVLGTILTLESFYRLFESIDKVDVTVKNRKLIIGGSISGVTIYTQSRLFDILNPKEVVALSIHEIGHNLTRWKSFKNLAKFLALALSSTTLVIILGIPILLLLNALVIIGISSRTLKKNEDMADSIAGQLGFADDFSSAIDKIDKFLSGTGIFSTSGFNIIEQLINLVTWIGWKIYRGLAAVGLAPYSSPTQRKQNALDSQKLAQARDVPNGGKVTSSLSSAESFLNNPEVLASVRESIRNTNIEMLQENVITDALLDQLTKINEKIASVVSQILPEN